MKYRVILLMALCVMSVSLAFGQQQRPSADDLISTSDLIVTGAVTDVQPSPVNETVQGMYFYNIAIKVDQALLGTKTTPSLTFTMQVLPADMQNPTMVAPPTSKGTQGIFFLQKSKHGLIYNGYTLPCLPLTELSSVKDRLKKTVTATLNIPGKRVTFGEAMPMTVQVTNPTDADIVLNGLRLNGFYFSPQLEEPISFIVQQGADQPKNAPIKRWADVVVKARGTVTIPITVTCLPPTSLALVDQESGIQIPAAVNALMSYANSDKTKYGQAHTDYLRILAGFPLPKTDDNFNPIPDAPPAGDQPTK